MLAAMKWWAASMVAAGVAFVTLLLNPIERWEFASVTVGWALLWTVLLGWAFSLYRVMTDRPVRRYLVGTVFAVSWILLIGGGAASFSGLDEPISDDRCGYLSDGSRDDRDPDCAGDGWGT